jgi:hypothetical protein
MSTEATANAGLTEEETAALAEMNEQINGASDDDPVFNIDEVMRKGHTPEDAGLVADKVAQEADAAKAAKEDEDAAALAAAAAKQPVEPTPEEKAAAEAKAVADAAAAAVEEPAPAEVKASQPVLIAQVPEGTVERLTAIEEERKAIAAKYDDGDLTDSERTAALDTLRKEERTLERVIDRAELATDLEDQRITNERTTEINTFLSDVKIPNDPKNLRFQTLNQAVIQVASDPANATLGATAIMQKAHDLCVAEGVLPPKVAKTDPAPAKDPVKAPKPINAPPTLAGVPAADVSTTEENRFAHLNRMNPDQREAAFGKMSEADQNAYLAAGA